MMLSVGLLLCAVMTLTGATTDPGPCYDLMDAGPCNSSIPSSSVPPVSLRFQYNSTSKECEAFIYGGCSTTRNNFVTREQCVQECVVPSPDWCLDPVKVGPCKARKPRWHFNTDTKYCERFMYGGCHGNKNNFPTEQECGDLCITPDESWCLDPEDVGPIGCYALMPRWHFTKDTKKCELFMYGGCLANKNNFLTEQACVNLCGHLNQAQWERPPVQK